MQIPALLILLAQLVRLSFGEIATRDEISYPIQFVVWLFGLRIFIIGIARAQRFHYGLALLNIVLVLIPLLVVVLMFHT
ncbi:hypothetical protein FNH22_06035 [Fulvivirga sp. M361]|uniref:hypothetical protein n=1 Tax=Fulvivirga sp. M361 TaxID=2594266 RepID=UPI00117AF54A|nr:hypothetical protein [Fulvivirga sp. M361]TRX60606.1 hypothetical protein FNH22_06035 [Fulvivirga sp. M361]